MNINFSVPSMERSRYAISIGNTIVLYYTIILWYDISIAELEITAGHRTFSDQIVEMTDQIPHATPQSLILCPSNVQPKHEPYSSPAIGYTVVYYVVHNNYYDNVFHCVGFSLQCELLHQQGVLSSLPLHTG